MDGEVFDLFDFAAATEAQLAAAEVPVPQRRKKTMSRSELMQAAFAFLTSLKPDAAAVSVPTRCSRFQAACAGFWRRANSRGRIAVTRSAIVLMYENIDSCFTDCAGREARMQTISQLQQQKSVMESEIRRNEPHLAASDDLFSEFRTWDYAASVNQEYHKLRRKLEKELHNLCKGSRLEKLRQAGVADLCYLAVPKGLIDPELLLPMWGLVELSPELPRFKVIRQAEMQDNVTPEGRNNLAVNVAVAASSAARFAAGVDASGALRRQPRKRSKLLK